MDQIAEKISDSELEVMKILWESKDALPVTEIRTQLRARKGWEATTVKTLISRLHSKGAIAQEKRNVFYYRPLISEDAYSDWAANDMVNRLFRGSAGKLIATLVRSKGLQEEDLAELKSMFRGED